MRRDRLRRRSRRLANAAIGIPATPMVITSDISGPYASPEALVVGGSAPAAGPGADPGTSSGAPVVVSEENRSGFYAVHWLPKPVQVRVRSSP